MLKLNSSLNSRDTSDGCSFYWFYKDRRKFCDCARWSKSQHVNLLTHCPAVYQVVFGVVRCFQELKLTLLLSDRKLDWIAFELALHAQRTLGSLLQSEKTYSCNMLKFACLIRLCFPMRGVYFQILSEGVRVEDVKSSATYPHTHIHNIQDW